MMSKSNLLSYEDLVLRKQPRASKCCGIVFLFGNTNNKIVYITGISSGVFGAEALAKNKNINFYTFLACDKKDLGTLLFYYCTKFNVACGSIKKFAYTATKAKRVLKSLGLKVDIRRLRKKLTALKIETFRLGDHTYISAQNFELLKDSILSERKVAE